MEEPRARGVSLWLMPEGPPRDRLAGLVERLAARLGTPSFAPHVTLLPGLPGPEPRVLHVARALAADLRPLAVVLSGIDAADAHFRCLFFRVTRSEALRRAHAQAAGRFGHDDPAFDPHLSLVYGTLAPALQADLTRELAPERPPPFEARHLHVWRTEGPVREWREIGRLKLGDAPGLKEE